ncbi:MAG: thiamine-phosphate kinase [Candidatus Brocadiales bacterium]
MRESKYIKYLREVQGTSKDVLKGIGDDAAVVRAPKGLCVLTTDTLLEGTHFSLKDTGPRALGRKAITSSLSDVAAMGCRATMALVSIAFPRSTPMRFARQLTGGLYDTAAKYGVTVVGGDTVSGKVPLLINVTVLGEADGLRPVLRSGARPGDAVMVTGELGGSILGKHLRFEPRLEEAVYLNRNFRLHSMIDISDGLSLDLGHILEESGVGAVLYEEQIPVSRAARRLARKTGKTGKKTPLHHALTDGEDYELLFTLNKSQAQRLIDKNPLKIPVTRIGRIRREKGLFLEDKKHGRLRRIRPEGYEHI